MNKDTFCVEPSLSLNIPSIFIITTSLTATGSGDLSHHGEKKEKDSTGKKTPITPLVGI